MEVIIFEKESYNKMMFDLMVMFKKAIREAKQEARAESDPSLDWIGAEEAMRILGCRKTKLQELRDGLLIKYSQNGRIIKYSKKSILAFLEKNASHF